LLPSESSNTILENISSENLVVENNDAYTPYFVKSNEIYSSTNNSLNTIENNDKTTEYLENATKVETEFSKFLQNGHKSKNSNENVSNIDEKFTEYIEINKKSEVNDKITKYLEENKKSDDVNDKITEYLQSLPEEKTVCCTIENNETLNETLTENTMLIVPKKHVKIKKVVVPVLKISSETKLEPLIDLKQFIQDDSSKKVKRTKSTGSKISENGKSTSQESPMSKKSNLNIEECSWDMLFDENGDCLEPSIMDEVIVYYFFLQCMVPYFNVKLYVCIGLQ
jgi:hypothetical protein